MKTRFFKVCFSLLLVIFSSAVFPDDGSWSRSFSISGGSVYSEEENESIVLEKELMIFNGESTTAHFLFRNLKDAEVIVDCGFPVVFSIDAYGCNGYLELPIGKYGPSANVPGLEFFETAGHPDAAADEPVFVYPEVILINDYNRSRNFIDADAQVPAGLDFTIMQDGRSVPVEKILVERKLSERSAEVILHHKHELVLPAFSRSIVSISYKQNLLYGNDGGAAADVFRWDYMIGTGGTWKGPIGEIYLIAAEAWHGELSGLKPVNRKQKDGVNIYYAENYEPSEGDVFRLYKRPVSLMEEYSFYSDFKEIKDEWINRSLVFSFDSEPVQPFVVSCSASSALTEKIDVFVEGGVIEDAEFTAAAAFDGFTETSWCENQKGAGVGEYLEVELSEPAAGFVLYNGFKRFSIQDWVFNTGLFESAVKDSENGFKDYFSMNNRVKRIKIIDEQERWLAAVELKDERDGCAYFGINLKPAKYRFTIDEVYSGTHWDDTCIGEITFIPAGESEFIARLFNDDFYSRILKLEMYN